jgi:hypothetical protein
MRIIRCPIRTQCIVPHQEIGIRYEARGGFESGGSLSIESHRLRGIDNDHGIVLAYLYSS